MEIVGYKNKEGKGVMRESFCAYFDILGFKEKIYDNDMEYFHRYLDILQNELTHLKLRQKEYGGEYEFKVFTDNFVFGYPWDDEDGEDGLGSLFEILSRIQYNFILKDIFIRGAIDHSNLFMNENVVFGPALIEAYKLESEKAIYPRIILSGKVKDLVKKYISYYSGGSAYHENEYLVDIDGTTFINYLFTIVEKCLLEEHTDEKAYVEKKVNAHKDAVIKNLVKYHDNYSVFSKYLWTGNYHNYFCENFLRGNSLLNVDDLLIPNELLNKSIRPI